MRRSFINTPDVKKPVESLKTTDRENKKNDDNQNGDGQKNNGKSNNKCNQKNSNRKNSQQEAKSEQTNDGSDAPATNDTKQELIIETVRSNKTKEHDNNRSQFATNKSVRSVKSEDKHSSDTVNSVRSEDVTGDMTGVAEEPPVNSNTVPNDTELQPIKPLGVKNNQSNSNTVPNDTELQLLIPLGAKNSQSIQICFLTILKKRRQQ